MGILTDAHSTKSLISSSLVWKKSGSESDEKKKFLFLVEPSLKNIPTRTSKPYILVEFTTKKLPTKTPKTRLLVESPS